MPPWQCLRLPVRALPRSALNCSASSSRLWGALEAGSCLKGWNADCDLYLGDQAFPRAASARLLVSTADIWPSSTDHTASYAMSMMKKKYAID